MPLLPIVERELRIASRRRATYWTRTAIVVMATIVGIVTFLMSVVLPVSKFGQLLFWGLSGMSMVYCLVAGRQMTADCLSEEKREGTFGLLFLTDLKGYDVVLGKLAARSFNGFYGLMATVPVLAIPLLVGGMTYGEFWRMVMVLVDTFLLSLSVGMFASATSRDYQHAMGRNFAVLLLTTALLPACAAALLVISNGRPIFTPLLFPCPVYAFFLCIDAEYTKAPVLFWSSVGTIHLLTWVLIRLACAIAPQSWQDKPSVPRAEADRKHKRWQWWREATAERRDAFRRRLLDQNAYYWLAGRPYVKPAWVWTLLALLVCWIARTAFAIGRFEATVCFAAALLANSSLKLWIALEAGQQLAADQKSGAFELLLSTPLTGREILRGQLMALARQFLKPLVAVIGVELIFMLILAQPRYLVGAQTTSVQVIWIWTAGIIMLAADAVALSVLGIATALTAKSYAHASMRTVRTILVVPWILYGFAILIRELWIEWVPNAGSSSLTWKSELAVYFGLGICVDVLFGWRAWRRLRGNFREMALRAYGPAPPGFFKVWRGRARALAARLWPKAQPGGEHSGKRRRAALALTGCVALCVGFILIRHASHKALATCLVVKLGPTNTALRIVSSSRDGLLFVLPDGSLWRWGKTVANPFNRVSTPERMGTNSDWVDVCNTDNHIFAFRNDGTVWAWNPASEQPYQVDTAGNCAAICARRNFLTMLKRDGTIWQRSVSSSRDKPVGDPYVVGTNSDWKAIRGTGGSTVALRQDGTLWVWGDVTIAGGFNTTSKNLANPVQVCAATNWTGLGSGFPLMARDQAGQLWNLHILIALPSANAPAYSVLSKIATNLRSSSPAFSFDYGQSPPVPVCYEARSDGTLWTTPSSWLPMMPRAFENWTQFTKSHNWISVWSDFGPVVAVTADGTLWTWGPDWGQEPITRRQSGISLVRERLRQLLAPSGPTTFGGTLWWQTQQIQKEPKPLMRLVPGAVESANQLLDDHNR